MFGLGGIYAELFKDVNFRIHPLTDIDAQEMINTFKARKILTAGEELHRRILPLSRIYC
jgi:hypothetical protein